MLLSLQRDEICATERELILLNLARHLRRNPLIHSVVPVASAKVPIIKFVLRDEETNADVECDLSLYNTLVSGFGAQAKSVGP